MKRFLLPILCLSAALSSCKKDTVEGPQGPQGPAGSNGSAPTGTLSGKAKQFDEYGIEYTTGLNTTTVTVEGTNLTAVTDATGNYSIPNVAPGVYNLTFTKPNAGLYKATQVTFPGNGTLYTSANVVDKSNTVFTTVLVNDTTMFGTQKLVSVHLSYSPVAKSRSVMFVFGKTNSIDLANPESYSAIVTQNLASNTTGVNSQFSIIGSNFNDFPSGSTVYVKAYPIATLYSGYYDAAIDEQIYTTYGTPYSTVFTVTKP